VSAVLDQLQSQNQPLFALADAGRSAEVLTLLHSFDVELRSLYEGDAEVQLGRSGPYLVSLPPDSDLLPALVRRGWGNAWVVILTADASFADLRRHFRRLLMVKRQRDGGELYFRFYDPRVLRVFLPTCSPEQLPQLFGPVSAFLMEDESGAEVLRFAPDAEQQICERLTLDRVAQDGPYA